ncbi:MAG: HU family DNA-binding protein, partial [Muribaculaceae bacterium]|nr:HU family DNA-binding protein [Muribaculaceae bacterium]
MGNKLTYSQFAQLMSGRCDIDIKVCEAFLKTLFRNITGGLDADEIVKIKDFGTFKVTSVASRKSVDVNTGEDNEIPAHRKVVFVPSKELATAVNRPFEMFETLEISADLSESEIMEALSVGDIETSEDLKGEGGLETEKVEMYQQPERKIESDATESVETVTLLQGNDTETEAYEKVEEEEEEEEDEKEEYVVEDILPEDKLPEDTMPQDMMEENQKPVRGFKHGFVWGIVAAVLIMLIGVGAVYYLYRDSITEILVHNGGVK